MKTTEERVDAVVIGGGLAGLTAATFLARQGRRVRLLEQSGALGGRARTKEQKGFHFNVGAHALYRGGHGIEVLRELGVEPQGAVPAAASGYIIRNGVKHTLPAGFVSLLTTSLFGLSAKLEIAGLLAALPKIDARPLLDVPLRQWLESRLSDPTARELILALTRVTTYMNAPDVMSAGAVIDQLQKGLSTGVLYLDHGWQVLVDGLAAAATEAGGEIQTGAKVEAVERDHTGRVRAVRTAGGQVIETPVVVIASSPQLVAEIVEGSETTSLAKLAKEAMAVKVACLDIALTSLPVPKATFALGTDRPLYFSVHSAAARLAPEGGALVHLMKYLPPHDESPGETAEQELEGLMDLMQPGWRERLVHRRFLPALTVAHTIVTAANHGLDGRPGPQITDVPGLFVAGDWVGNKGMLADASLASGRRAAELAALYYPIAHRSLASLASLASVASLLTPDSQHAK